jgi:hypothetical protein
MSTYTRPLCGSQFRGTDGRYHNCERDLVHDGGHAFQLTNRRDHTDEVWIQEAQQ